MGLDWLRLCLVDLGVSWLISPLTGVKLVVVSVRNRRSSFQAPARGRRTFPKGEGRGQAPGIPPGILGSVPQALNSRRGRT
jgi:hypothetical protein